ncbi:hypothetical protein BDV18DRAFT_163426 [Aspergillus unguis]
MNPQGFSFPPPPPPPPTQTQSQQQYPHNTAYTPYGQNQHGQRGGRGGGGGNFRGRGRGYGNRGAASGRGGHAGGYTATAGGYGPMTYLGYPTQHMPTQQTPAAYSQTPSQNYSSPVNGNSFASTSHYGHPSLQATPYQHQSGYNTAYAAPSTAYNQTPQSNQLATPSTQPPMMGPPMRWGFEGTGTGHSGPFPGQRTNQRGGRHNQSNGNHVNKRDHTSAFGKPQSTAPRVPAPPPVPSFGNPLPLKPPVPADSPRKPKKKKRKHNQLGLTPKTDAHESSEEEDDADEESRLAAGGSEASAALQVTYRGRTSTLQSSADIAAWIAERKKRFPTQAKIEENKKVMEEAKKAKKEKEEAQRQQKEARKLAAQRAKKEQEKNNQKDQAPADAAAKAKQKAEKLRRKLEKEEKRIAQAEADAERARKLEAPEEGAPISTAQGADDLDVAADKTINNSISDTSEDSDWTSSSGSNLSSSESDESDDDDDAPPEETTSRREGPERVAPPARDEKKKLCRHFARNGRCPRGKSCKFLHEKPERATKAKQAENKGRKGLLEALLERQKEDENRKLMETIVWLGENGHLDTDEPAAQNDASLDSTAANGASDNQTEDHQPPEA